MRAPRGPQGPLAIAVRHRTPVQPAVRGFLRQPPFQPHRPALNHAYFAQGYKSRATDRGQNLAGKRHRLPLSRAQSVRRWIDSRASPLPDRQPDWLAPPQAAQDAVQTADRIAQAAAQPRRRARWMRRFAKTGLALT